MAITRVDPFRTFNFFVEVDGILERGGFQECSGLDVSTDAIEYREGTDGANHTRKLVGMNKYSPITLKRGVVESDVLWKWRLTVIEGKTERRNGSIVLLDEAGVEKVRWNFTNAWPSKWSGPAFNSTSNGIAIETLELTHEEVVRA